MRILLVALLALTACPKPTPTPSPGPGPGPAPTPDAAPAPAPTPADVFDTWLAAINASKWDDVTKMYAGDATAGPASAPKQNTPEKIRLFLEAFKVGFPDASFETRMMFTRPRATVAVLATSGTNTEAVPGLGPATGKKVASLLLVTTEVNEYGKISKQVLYGDNLNFLGQLGVTARPHRAADAISAPDPLRAAETDDDATKANVELVGKVLQAITAHKAPDLVPLYAPAAIYDDISEPAPIVAPAAIARHYSNLFPAFPDLQVSDDVLWGSGDWVIATYKLSGTNGGVYPRFNVKSSMLQIDLEVATLARVQGGKIAHQYVFLDGLAMSSQLGAEL